MPAPLDPVVEKIIPLLPLRDPAIMTPVSARESLRARAAARARTLALDLLGPEGFQHDEAARLQRA